MDKKIEDLYKKLHLSKNDQEKKNILLQIHKLTTPEEEEEEKPGEVNTDKAINKTVSNLSGQKGMEASLKNRMGRVSNLGNAQHRIAGVMDKVFSRINSRKTT